MLSVGILHSVCRLEGEGGETLASSFFLDGFRYFKTGHRSPH